MTTKRETAERSEAYVEEETRTARFGALRKTGSQVADGRDVRTRKRRRNGSRNGGPKRPSTSPRSGKDVGRDGRMRDAHHRAEGGSTCSGRGEAERTSVRNAELAIEAVALRLARVSRPAPVTETQSLSVVRGARWSGRRNQTARFAFFGKSDERVEVRRQGVGSNAGPHFRLGHFFRFGRHICVPANAGTQSHKRDAL
ncbi:MAG: hypothetical protein JWL96_2733 [Sphingomonas bacterium]|nr:hypothetical protein [Sphingomonas bacterium]